MACTIPAVGTDVHGRCAEQPAASPFIHADDGTDAQSARGTPAAVLSLPWREAMRAPAESMLATRIAPVATCLADAP
jgi:hypothetical protein